MQDFYTCNRGFYVEVLLLLFQVKLPLGEIIIIIIIDYYLFIII